MPDPEKNIRSSVAALSSEQQQFAQHMAESLEVLESYQQSLEEWQSQLAAQAQEMAERDRKFEADRQQLIQQHATDVAMTAELDQVRAEVDELRHQLSAKSPTSVAETVCVADKATERTVPMQVMLSPDTIELSMNSVAKQFHKLRQQQAARHSSRAG